MSQLTKHAKVIGRLRVLACVVAGPAVTMLLSVAAMAQALKVWQWRPGDPIDLSGDSLSGLAQLKNVLDRGWSGINPNLGAPFHQDANWFPNADQLHLFLTGKVIGLVSDNPFTVSAIYFFLGFPLAALSMYWLARQRHLGRPARWSRASSSRSCPPTRPCFRTSGWPRTGWCPWACGWS